ncbi:MAG: hypothetical protein IH898_10975 [Planctomycetes bacterium]|nr:hypothetical protein [Planctomycetota bacterium]
MPDQADQLRQLVRQAVEARPTLGPGAPIVVLSGGRSGVGTTTLAIQLARELTRLGKRTVLVDANLAKPQLAARLEVPTHGCLADVLDGSRSVGEVLQLVDEGVSLLASRPTIDAPPHLNRAAIARLLMGLRSLGSQADVVLVDAGHGMSPWAERWWRAAQQVFLIATPQEAAVKDSYLAVKLAPWGDADGKVQLVVNQCDDRLSAEQITKRFSITCRRFLGLHVEGAPPVACSQGETEGETFTADASVAFCQSVRLLATEIISHNVVVRSRIASRQANHNERLGEPLAHMLAVTEKSLDSPNNPQTVPHK